MRKIVIVMTAAALVATAGAAHAQSASQQINLSATVGSSCSFVGSDGSQSATGAQRSGVVYVNANYSVNANSAVPLSGTDATVTCSNTAKIQLTSQKGGLTHPEIANAAVTGTKKIQYTVQASIGSLLTHSMTTSQTTMTEQSSTSGSATSGAVSSQTLALTVTASPGAATTGLAVGSFTDTLTVTLLPQS
jgi:hypothetical protein